MMSYLSFFMFDFYCFLTSAGCVVVVLCRSRAGLKGIVSRRLAASFTDAELGEDGVHYVLGGGLARDLAEGIICLAQIHESEVYRAVK